MFNLIRRDAILQKRQFTLCMQEGAKKATFRELQNKSGILKGMKLEGEMGLEILKNG